MSNKAVSDERLAGRIVGVSALFVAVLACAWLALLASGQRVTHVEIKGDFRHLDRDAVINAIGEHVDVPMFGVHGAGALDLARVRAAALDLGWVRSVSVQRQWPHRLAVAIEERVPVARWNADRLIDARGDVFDPGLDTRALAPAIARLPALYGPNGRVEEVLTRYQDLSALVRDARLEPLVALRQSGRGAWLATLADGLRIRLGKLDDEARTLARLRVLGGLIDGTDAQVVSADLRYRDGFALRFAAPDSGERVTSAAPAAGESPA